MTGSKLDVSRVVLAVVSTFVLTSTVALAQPEATPPDGAQPEAQTEAKPAQPEAQPETEPAQPEARPKAGPADPTPEDNAAQDNTAQAEGEAAGDKSDAARIGADGAEGETGSDPMGFGTGTSDKGATEAEPVAHTLGARRHEIDAGVFLGGNYFANQLELGNSYFDDQVPTSGFLLGARATYLLIPNLMAGSSLDPSLSVEVEAKLALSSTAGDPDAMRDSYSAPVLGWRAHAVLSIWNERKLRPFALLGIGGETAFSSSPFVYSVDTDAELHYGLGAVYQLADDYGVRADFRHGITAGRFSVAASTIEFHAGFYYSFGFGGSRPAPKPVDEDKNTAEMNNTDPDIVVEPLPSPEDVDSDGDGLNDDVDKCPKEAETINQIDDEDGCPEVDSDGDKLVDSRDQCPNEAEDPDGFQDEDGCPDRDDDNDGRPDSIDECPNKAEVLNGFEDDNGCPDEIPSEVEDALQNLLFRPRNAQVKTLRKRLDSLKAVLDKHPSIRLRISGHAAGNEKKPSELSEKRANAVKDYLVGAGIDAGRLETVGHGADKPIANNRTRSGKARNRRVELELLPGPAQIPDPTAPTPGATTAPTTPGPGVTPTPATPPSTPAGAATAPAPDGTAPAPAPAGAAPAPAPAGAAPAGTASSPPPSAPTGSAAPTSPEAAPAKPADKAP